MESKSYLTNFLTGLRKTDDKIIEIQCIDKTKIKSANAQLRCTVITPALLPLQ